jgi:SAM-dependent methyltransferase
MSTWRVDDMAGPHFDDQPSFDGFDQVPVVQRVDHPAKFSPQIVAVLRDVLDRWGVRGLILDPFAGVGGVHALARSDRVTFGVELEPEWAGEHAGPVVRGDACALPFPDATFDAITVSPTYGNRMADKDMRPSTAATYMKSLGREASAASSCHLQWPSPAYWELHRRAWCEAERVLRPGGLFVLNVSDHRRRHQWQSVVDWHVSGLLRLGLDEVERVPVGTCRMRYGANADARASAEWVVVLKKYER